MESAPNIDNLVELEVASLRVRELIEQAPMERAFEGALRDAYDELCFRHGDVSLAVAVRSSAAGEDAATASFAGQYESYSGTRAGYVRSSGWSAQCGPLGRRLWRLPTWLVGGSMLFLKPI